MLLEKQYGENIVVENSMMELTRVEKSLGKL